MTARDDLKLLLHNEGAYCGGCDFEDFDRHGCPDCDRVLGKYADAIIARGWRPTPAPSAVEGGSGPVMTDTLRDWADKCEACAIDALDLHGETSEAKGYLEVAMLLDQRADYIEERGRIVDAEFVETRVRELLGIIERADAACRERIESSSVVASEVALFASDLRDILRVPL